MQQHGVSELEAAFKVAEKIDQARGIESPALDCRKPENAMEQKRPSIPMQVQAFRRRRWRLSWPWVLAAVLVALLLIWLVSRYSGKSTPQTSTPVSVMQVAGPPWQMGNPEGRFTLTLYATSNARSADPISQCSSVGWPATRTWPCNGTTSRWPRMSRPRLPKRAWRSAPANLAAMPPSGRLSSGSMPTRAATARACPRPAVPRPYASHRAVSGERTARGADPHPDGGSHEQRRDRHAVAAAARSRNRQGDPTAGSRSRAMPCCRPWTCSRPAIPPPHLLHRKCLPTSSATCPGSPGLQGYGAVHCADRNPFASHPGRERSPLPR